MDEMRMLRDHHDAQPSPSADSVVAARARLAAHARPRRLQLPRLGRLALGAGALGAALAVGLVVVQVVDGDREPGVLKAEPASAAEVLSNAATAARHRHDPEPRPTQFVYTEVLRSEYGSGGVRGAQRGWQNMHFRTWIPADGKADGLLQEKRTGGGAPAGEAWSTSPLRQPNGGPLDDPNNYLSLDRLPRDPDRLLAELHRRYPGRHSADPIRDRSSDEEVFDGVEEMVTQSYVPPTLRAALFQATKKIPGITLVKDAVDAAGRHGVAVALTFKDGTREEIIFDRGSYVPLGSRDVLDDPAAYNRRFTDLKGVARGQTLSVTALLSTRVVDRPGRLS
ncbi:CU044_5270 family protein [Actinoallomurus iriomotensis]|uniref:CU044_5270 family protein n=1 Tax=Actinoallomurus iriomotensis TaxID=478107 RepID=A0A9W6SCV7_9ACTN|nr:CU044_5270 family protein [Actinoallomurus iriomotensis]GLY91276.1 hypothetical protein Airi02_092050 [Actinoallomurus iriomotensis]